MYFRFMDDVTFGRNGPYGETWRLNRYAYATATSGVVRPGRSLKMSMNALLLRFGRGAEYCDQLVCLCVCLSAIISPEPLYRSA